MSSYFSVYKMASHFFSLPYNNSFHKSTGKWQYKPLATGKHVLKAKQSNNGGKLLFWMPSSNLSSLIHYGPWVGSTSSPSPKWGQINKRSRNLKIVGLRPWVVCVENCPITTLSTPSRSNESRQNGDSVENYHHLVQHLRLDGHLTFKIYGEVACGVKLPRQLMPSYFP